MFEYSDKYLNLKFLEYFADEIGAEYDRITTLKKWSEIEKYSGNWDVFGLYHSGRQLKLGKKICPITCGVLSDLQSIVSSPVVMAGFSRMSPGTEIHPHVDDVSIEKRIHLGVKIPEGDCALEVDGHRTLWTQGQAFVFDPRKIHSAYNRTSQERVVFLLDFKNFS